MSISSSLNAGVAGLAANATRLAGIADNIANSGTYGYKRVNTDFEGLVIGGSRGASTYSAGGVRALSTRLIGQKGALISTSNALDLAVSGRGMLPVTSAAQLGTGSRAMMMTSTGSFRPDEKGLLRTDSGLVLMGWPANADGTIPPMSRDSADGLQPVVLNANQISATPTTAIGMGINLPALATKAGATLGPQTTRIEYFGNLGTSESLEVTFTPAPAAGTGLSNAWTMEIRDSAQPAGSNLIGSYALVFDDSQAGGGTLASVTTLSGGGYDPATGQLSLTVAGGSISAAIGRLGDPKGLTQFDAGFAPVNVERNGAPAGNLTGVEVDENGFLRATYDTGFVRTLYQIPLVDVPNPNGLAAMSNQTYQVSPDSGALFLWNAGDGPTGAIMGHAREGSATDVAAELTDMIQTQRAYSSNAKVIQTVDEMLQETTNIKR